MYFQTCGEAVVEEINARQNVQRRTAIFELLSKIWLYCNRHGPFFYAVLPHIILKKKSAAHQQETETDVDSAPEAPAPSRAAAVETPVDASVGEVGVGEKTPTEINPDELPSEPVNPVAPSAEDPKDTKDEGFKSPDDLSGCLFF